MWLAPILLALAGSLALQPIPLHAADPAEPPAVAAAAWLLYDVDTGVTLAARNAGEPRPMASVTKLMTAVVVRERAALDETVTVSIVAATVGEAGIGLVAGEQWSVGDLLAAMMVRSGNDAAVALAEHVAGSVDDFAVMMNVKAAELGMTVSRFTNPHGLDEPGHMTSAEDLLTLTLAAMEDPVLARLARTRVILFKPDPEGTRRRAENTNALLGAYPGVIGVKTGFTSGAGRVLITEAGADGRTLITVVLGAEDHFADTRALLEYGFATYGPADRVAAGLLRGTPSGTPGSVLDGDRARRLVALPPLDPGTWTRSAPLETPGGRRMEAWLRGLLPSLLGGTP